MTTPTAPSVELRPFAEFDLLSLARTLAGMVWRNKERLHVDFPQVIRRYEDTGVARESIEGVCRNVKESYGRFGAYIAMVNGRECGVFSYQQSTLRYLGFKKALVSGPLVAGWLDWGRTSDERKLLVSIMHVGAQVLASQPAVTGYAYTLVRPTHARVRETLEQEAQATPFGTFQPQGKPRAYPVDGVHTKRQLYVAQHDMATIRT